MRTGVEILCWPNTSEMCVKPAKPSHFFWNSGSSWDRFYVLDIYIISRETRMRSAAKLQHLVTANVINQMWRSRYLRTRCILLLLMVQSLQYNKNCHTCSLVCLNLEYLTKRTRNIPVILTHINRQDLCQIKAFKRCIHLCVTPVLRHIS